MQDKNVLHSFLHILTECSACAPMSAQVVGPSEVSKSYKVPISMEITLCIILFVEINMKHVNY